LETVEMLRQKLYIARYNGSAWVDVGAGSTSGNGILSATQVTDSFRMQLDENDQPVVVWRETSGAEAQVLVKRFNGTAWVELGAGSASGGGVSASLDGTYSPRLVVNAANDIYVAWADTGWNYNGDVCVKHWNGSSWAEVGAHSASDGCVTYAAGANWDYERLALAANAFGQVVVAWLDGWNNAVYLLRYSEGVWGEVGAGSASGFGLLHSGGELKDMQLLLGGGDTVNLAVNDDFLGDDAVYLWRWERGAWQLLRDVFVAQSSVNDRQVGALMPSMALDDMGRPMVAWYQSPWRTPVVAVRRWNEAQWVDVGVGAASGGGVSNNLGGAGWPSLATRGTRACVAYAEASELSTDIAVRCVAW